MKPIVICNSSSVFKLFTDWKPVVEALQVQVKEIASVWSLEIPVMEAYVTKADAYAWDCTLIELTEMANVGGADGYHSETDKGVVFSRVFIKPIIDAGGNMDDVTATISHELAEIMVNYNANMWVYNDLDDYEYAREAADPVQEKYYQIGGVSLSSYVYPDWFDQKCKKPCKFDKLGSLSAPFSLTAGGYMIRKKEDKIEELYGHLMPAWQKELKNQSGRINKLKEIRI